MSKRKITIEIEVESMGLYDYVNLKDFTSKLQLSITDAVQKETRKWNRFSSSSGKMCLTLLSNKNEAI